MIVKQILVLFITVLALGAAVFVGGCTIPGEENETPTATPTATPDGTPIETPGAENETIVQVLSTEGNFTTLVAALQAAGLDDTLEGTGPFTVFAPTDEAFDALPEGMVDELLDDPEGNLTEVLLYHVTTGELLASDVIGMENITTIQGSDIAVNVTDGTVMLDGAEVIQADVMASNGVIHVIDAVMVPPDVTLPGTNETGTNTT